MAKLFSSKINFSRKYIPSYADNIIVTNYIDNIYTTSPDAATSGDGK